MNTAATRAGDVIDALFAAPTGYAYIVAERDTHRVTGAAYSLGEARRLCPTNGYVRSIAHNRIVFVRN